MENAANFQISVDIQEDVMFRVKGLIDIGFESSEAIPINRNVLDEHD